MASRLLSFVSCTLYFSIIISFTIIGFVSLIVGAVGLARFIPTYVTYNTYMKNLCFVIDSDYDIGTDSYYTATWSVQYYASNGTSDQSIYSTITQRYDSIDKTLEKIDYYCIGTRYTCYYDSHNLNQVQWDEPASPQPYFIMMVIGLGLNVSYIISIATCSFFQSRKATT